MKFRVVGYYQERPKPSEDIVYLVRDNWDDFGYKTTFIVEYVDTSGKTSEVGAVRVGRFKLKDRYDIEMPTVFEQLDVSFFSVGANREYYEALKKLGPSVRTAVLSRLRDVAFDDTLFDAALKEEITTKSLLRFTSVFSVRGQFRRLAHGGNALSPFSFEFQRPAMPGSEVRPQSLNFKVEPDSKPPSNIHVLIGRNGVGKSHCFVSMANTIVGRPDSNPRGKFIEHAPENPEDVFANLVLVAFSLFDTGLLVQIRNNNNPESSVRFYPIGILPLEPRDLILGGTPATSINLEFNRQFRDALETCVQSRTLLRWKKLMKSLECDPILRDLGFEEMVPHKSSIELAARTFDELSSGHKIICLTLTKLAAIVAERSLVLIDEPESHLHPPLLSAFIRGISELLIEQNGVAIIATHSPVVLQEVPAECVWILDRSGQTLTANRPSAETFGENVGTLTRDVFRLEVGQSGYNKLLIEAVNQNDSYEAVLNYFDGKLGSEARAIIRGLIATKATHND